MFKLIFLGHQCRSVWLENRDVSRTI